MMMMMMMFRVSPSLGPHPPLHRFSPSSSTRSSSFSTLYSFFSSLLRLIQTFSIYLSSFDRSIHSIQFSPPSDFDSDSGSDFGSGFPYSSLLIRSSLDRWGLSSPSVDPTRFDRSLRVFIQLSLILSGSGSVSGSGSLTLFHSSLLVVHSHQTELPAAVELADPSDASPAHRPTSSSI